LKKIVGICFGHQIVAQALGGKVELNDNGWEIAVREVYLDPTAKQIFHLDSMVLLISVV
jgi:GMP synthase-like glutamine amidotransferase